MLPGRKITNAPFISREDRSEIDAFLRGNSPVIVGMFH